VLLLQSLLQVLGGEETLRLMLWCVGGLGIFYLVREAFIGLMWRQLLRRFHADSAAFYRLARI
jgi:hypothetical protein